MALAVLGVLSPIGMQGLNICMDMLPAGHVHAYERTWPVNNYKLDPCGPVNIIIGKLRNLV